VTDSALRDYYAARAPEYDDWYLRLGRYSHGDAADAQWVDELELARAWLDGLSLNGDIVELAAGTGWWSPVLARKGELWMYDVAAEPLAFAAERLRRLGLTAHIELRDAWSQPDRQVDALFMGFWISHVERARLAQFLTICQHWLKPGGKLAFIDSRLDPQSSATDHPRPVNDFSLRRLTDGREFVIPKVYWQPGDLEDALRAADFTEVSVQQTPRFFLLGSAVAGA
jgi:ubiquinone/menaquinone biosynthesis C-methylase UbiE